MEGEQYDSKEEEEDIDHALLPQRTWRRREAPPKYANNELTAGTTLRQNLSANNDENTGDSSGLNEKVCGANAKKK
jgi:hypothetical protein